MILMDYARQIEPNASPERLDAIGRILHLFAANELCCVGQTIDEEFFKDRISYAPDAAKVVRAAAVMHLHQT
jgi:hypothetical protein